MLLSVLHLKQTSTRRHVAVSCRTAPAENPEVGGEPRETPARYTALHRLGWALWIVRVASEARKALNGSVEILEHLSTSL